jgi:hypothetical protein
MRLSLSSFPLTATLLGVLLLPAAVQAQQQAAPILITYGDTITHIGNVTAPNAAHAGAAKVGFKSSYFGVFWIDLWTWGGEFCVYEGDRPHPITPAEAARLLGKSESDLSKPFLYRFPLGLLILGPLAVVGFVSSMFEKKKQAAKEVAIEQLLTDPTYQKAMTIMVEQSRPPVSDAPANSSPESADQIKVDDADRTRVAFDAAIEYVVGSGVPREEAERNLPLVVQAVARAQSEQKEASAKENPS